MAASGRIIGSYLPGRGQRLEIDWTQTPDPATHTSTVTCTVYITHSTATYNSDSARHDNTASCGDTSVTWDSLRWVSNSAADQTQGLSAEDIVWTVACDATGAHAPVTLGFRYHYQGSAWVTASAEIQLDPVPLASVFASVPASVTAGQTLSIGLTQYLASYYPQLALQVNSGTPVYRNISGGAQGYTETVPLSWLTDMPDSATGTLTLTLTTYSDEERTVVVGTPDTATLDLLCPSTAGPATPPPSVTWLTISPDNSGTPGAGSISAYITDISQASATAVIGTYGVRGQYGASIVSASITCGASTVTAAVAPGAASVTVKAVAPSQAGQYTITVRFTDSRGLSLTRTETVTYQTWLPPVLTTAVAQRWDTTLVDHNMGTDIRVTASATCASIIDAGGTDINSMTLSASYRQAGTSAWTDYSGTITDGQPVVITGGNISTTHSYDVRIRATDALWITDQIITVPKSSVTLNFLPGGDGAAFGGYATQDGLTIFWSHIDAPNFTTGGILIKAQDANGVAKTFRVLGVEVSS